MIATTKPILLLKLLVLALIVSPQLTVAAELDKNILYSLDFSSQPDGSALDWLKQNGFVIELDATKLNPRFENHQLVLSTNDELAGIFGLRVEDKNLTGVESVEVEWSVSRFPDGASWEKGNNRVAVALMIFFGTERLSSGLPFGINSAPYFFSPFVTNVDPPGKKYLGKLYKKGGRYYSVGAPENASEIFTTDFELKQRFLTEFKKKEVPAVTAVAFQMNTEDTKGGAVASIRRISFIGKP